MSESSVDELTPQQAYQLLLDEPKAVLVDVRSHMEFLFIGHPVGAINIPWIDEPDWEVNPNFVRELRQLLLGGLAHDDTGGQRVPVVLICRSGKRSLEAGKLLLQEGFDRVYNVREGFEGELDEHHHRSSQGGWRFAGLPWEQC
ncbi:rhodanese-like domain-containing protein [Thiohalophilus thiocyanatoxydans]|uniref:Thiosulfate sulfurtransferase n=1 Tax=Thiohalophilus thiocyanatoxydans TaxID=381308 RepID=A0A4R8ISI5_9GAMM|nr:rhodanese-like domain-containing protein [Thiohalophilus thiocyanatoxydans]TDY00509.1 thiosulfate sulfurtransferase [Thiohalophilus thiocyanatoxydans]